VLGGLVLVAGATVAARAAGVGWVVHDPVFSVGLGPGELLLVAAILGAGVLPFAGARARLGVRRVA
jgi:hypothetical protein